MPRMGISVSEGTILEWRKQPGDWVEADETIAEVTTDKVDVEIPSPASGRLVKILVEAGKTVPVGEAIAEIDPRAKAGEAHPDEHPSADSGPVAPEREAPDRSAFISPVVRRIADSHGVDLEQVEGTGIGGRIRKKDVLAYVESHAGNGQAAEPPRMLHTESPYRPEPEPEVAGLERTGDRRVPMTPMRLAIARHMLESRRTAAHCTTVVEVDMSRVAARRAELKDAMARRGVKLTYLAFVAKAAVEALAD